jgi:hypothetical protein
MDADRLVVGAHFLMKAGVRHLGEVRVAQVNGDAIGRLQEISFGFVPRI